MDSLRALVDAKYIVVLDVTNLQTQHSSKR